MRLARKLFLVAFAAIAMVAFAAPAANAIEVSAEPNGTHCSEVEVSDEDVVSGGCVVEGETDEATPVTLRQHATMGGEIVFSICDSTITVALHESGDGFIYDQVLGGAQCGVAPCDNAEPGHAKKLWPLRLLEIGGVERLMFTACIRPPGTPGSGFIPCTTFGILTEQVDHEYELATLPLGQSRCSQNAQIALESHWQIVDLGIEVNH